MTGSVDNYVQILVKSRLNNNVKNTIVLVFLRKLYREAHRIAVVFIATYTRRGVEPSLGHIQNLPSREWLP